MLKVLALVSHLGSILVSDLTMVSTSSITTLKMNLMEMISLTSNLPTKSGGIVGCLIYDLLLGSDVTGSPVNLSLSQIRKRLNSKSEASKMRMLRSPV